MTAHNYGPNKAAKLLEQNLRLGDRILIIVEEDGYKALVIDADQNIAAEAHAKGIFGIFYRLLEELEAATLPPTPASQAKGSGAQDPS